jgi:hypothetical protein
MTGVAYLEVAQQYASVGMVPIPLGGEDGKRPLVRNPGRFRMETALRVAPRFPEANVGIWCGRRNSLTVIDVDSRDERELAWALDNFGASPVIVRTGSGKFHAWYRHGGERRRIRPFQGHEIDVLGENGYAVAPPSVRPNGAQYEFISGGLEDLAALPTIRFEARAGLSGRTQKADPGQPTGRVIVLPGNRNATLFDRALVLASTAPSLGLLVTQLQDENIERNAPPLPSIEVEKLAASVWRYKVGERLFAPGRQEIVIHAKTLDAIGGDADVCLLYLNIRRAHGCRREDFALVARAMADAQVIPGWNVRRYRNATRRLCSLGLIVMTHRGGSGAGDPSTYRLQKGAS